VFYRYVCAPFLMAFLNILFWSFGYGSVKCKNELIERVQDYVPGDEDNPKSFYHQGLGGNQLTMRSNIVHNSSSNKIQDVSAAAVFDYLEHNENTPDWQKSVDQCVIPEYSPTKEGLGTFHLSYGRMSFLTNFRVARFLANTRYDKENFFFECSQNSPFTTCVYRNKVEPIEGEDACIFHFYCTVALNSVILSKLLSESWWAKTQQNLLDLHCQQVWRAYDRGLDLTGAQHKKLGADALGDGEVDEDECID